jgi:hypothetical protein
MPESVVDLLDEYAVRHGCTQADAFWMLYERRKAPAASDRDGGQTRRS